MTDLADAPTLLDRTAPSGVTEAAAAAMQGVADAATALRRAADSYASDAFRLADVDEGWAFFYRTIARELHAVADGLGVA